MTRRPTESLRILITDAQELAGLAAVRSLGRAGQRVVAGWPRGLARPAAVLSRYCAAGVQYPDPWAMQLEFRDWLRAALASGDYDAILPVTEAAVVALAAVRSETQGAGDGPLLLLPSDAALRYTLSKYHATAKALEVGVDCPETVFVAEDAPAEAQRAALARLTFPIILKSDNYLSAGGAYKKGRTIVVPDLEQAIQTLRDFEGKPTRVLAQQLVPGRGAGAFLLRFGGATQLRFAHRRLHEVPYTGGFSSLRESCHDAELTDLGERMLAAIDYEGAAMVEFRRAPDGRLYFMEINGRLWGSLALALHAGVDFPRALLECHCQGHPARRDADYPDGLRCRSVFPAEIAHVISIMKARPVPGQAPPPSRLKALAEFVALSLNPAIRHDHFWWSDPLPGLVHAAQTSGELGGKAILKGVRPFKRWRENKALGRLRAAHEARARGPIYFDPPPRRILFLCYGNICRSPFAERYWNALVEKRDHPGLPHAVSGGYFPESGRRTPAWIADLVRAECGLELADHRSRRLAAGDLVAVDAVFLMDRHNYREFLAEFPQARAKTYLLGLFDGEGGEVEIDDPYLMDREEACRCYRQLARALEGLARRIERDLGRNPSAAPAAREGF